MAENKKNVSELMYTKNNYDNNGRVIKEELPTITTDFCEIGLHNNTIYFVFIIDSTTFSLKLFTILKKLHVTIYWFTKFNKTLYPAELFEINHFMKMILEDKYLQIQIDYKKINSSDLFKSYCNLVDIFEKNKAIVINQLKVDLMKIHQKFI